MLLCVTSLHPFVLLQCVGRPSYIYPPSIHPLFSPNLSLSSQVLVLIRLYPIASQTSPFFAGTFPLSDTKPPKDQDKFAQPVQIIS